MFERNTKKKLEKLDTEVNESNNTSELCSEGGIKVNISEYISNENNN